MARACSYPFLTRHIYGFLVGNLILTCHKHDIWTQSAGWARPYDCHYADLNLSCHGEVQFGEGKESR
jgi:hypothetical protein